MSLYQLESYGPQIDPEHDCRNLQTLMHRVCDDDIGDSLFKFLVVETIEGGEGTLDGAIRVIGQARDDVEAVLKSLIYARDSKRSNSHQ